MRLEMRYVKQQVRRRKRRDGSVWQREYWYYRRPGAPDHEARLPGKPSDPEFVKALGEFNARAEHVPPAQMDGTFANLVSKYTASADFLNLRPKTRQDYAANLRRLDAIFGAFLARDIDREAVYELRDRFAATPHQANYLLRVLRLILGWAVERGTLSANVAARPKQFKVRPRRQVWSVEAEEVFLAVADQPIRLAYLLHAYTAQRQADILRMSWGQYDGTVIRLRQAKTDQLVEVPVHRVLRAALEATPRVATTILTDSRGIPWRPDNFRHRWREITLTAGLDGLQNRDLRRTAMVRMAEAGATDIQIAAVSGHDIETTRRILEIYIPRNGRMAAAAVKRLEAAGPRLKPKKRT